MFCVCCNTPAEYSNRAEAIVAEINNPQSYVIPGLTRNLVTNNRLVFLPRFRVKPGMTFLRDTIRKGLLNHPFSDVRRLMNLKLDAYWVVV